MCLGVAALTVGFYCIPPINFMVRIVNRNRARLIASRAAGHLSCSVFVGCDDEKCRLTNLRGPQTGCVVGIETSRVVYIVPETLLFRLEWRRQMAETARGRVCSEIECADAEVHVKQSGRWCGQVRGWICNSADSWTLTRCNFDIVLNSTLADWLTFGSLPPRKKMSPFYLSNDHWAGSVQLFGQLSVERVLRLALSHRGHWPDSESDHDWDTQWGSLGITMPNELVFLLECVGKVLIKEDTLWGMHCHLLKQP